MIEIDLYLHVSLIETIVILSLFCLFAYYTLSHCLYTQKFNGFRRFILVQSEVQIETQQSMFFCTFLHQSSWWFCTAIESATFCVMKTTIKLICLLAADEYICVHPFTFICHFLIKYTGSSKYVMMSIVNSTTSMMISTVLLLNAHENNLPPTTIQKNYKKSSDYFLLLIYLFIWIYMTDGMNLVVL